MATSDSLGNFFFVPEPDYNCPGSPFACPPPSACARDPTTGRTFCCDPESVCWSGSTTCASDGSTFECGTEGSWCCTSETESCTGTNGQINICWSKKRDVLVDIGSPVLKKTYSSLSAANPDASSWPFSPQTLIAATDTTSQSSTTTPSSSTASSSTPSSSTPSSTATTAAPTTTAVDNTAAAGTSQTPSPSSDASSSSKSLSGGAIGGIVVGAVGALVLVALAVFFLRRRRRNQAASDKHAGIPWAALPPQPGVAHELSTGHQDPMHELPSSRPVVELPGNTEYYGKR